MNDRLSQDELKRLVNKEELLSNDELKKLIRHYRQALFFSYPYISAYRNNDYKFEYYDNNISISTLNTQLTKYEDMLEKLHKRESEELKPEDFIKMICEGKQVTFNLDMGYIRVGDWDTEHKVLDYHLSQKDLREIVCVFNNIIKK